MGYANSEIRDFMNDKTSERGRAMAHLIVERKVRQRGEKRQRDKRGKESEASEPVTAWSYN